jgi:hypothetical protein
MPTIPGSQSVHDAAVTTAYAGGFVTPDLNVRVYDRIFVHLNPTGSGPSQVDMKLQSVTNSIAADMAKIGSDGAAALDEVAITVSDLPLAMPISVEGIETLRIALKADLAGLSIDLRVTGSTEDGVATPKQHSLV